MKSIFSENKMKSLVLLFAVALLSGCTTRLTVNKPFAEVKAGMQKMEQNINAGRPTFAQWNATNTPGQLAQSTNQTPNWQTNGAVFEGVTITETNKLSDVGPGDTGKTNLLRFNPRSGPNLPWGMANLREMPDGNVSLHIYEKVQNPMNTIPVGDIATTIEAKPAGPNRTKVTVVTKKYGSLIDSREREIEKRRRAELSDILRAPSR
jgi:hypothetical protein